MKENGSQTLTPKLRFPEFRKEWQSVTVGDFFDLADTAEKTTTFDRDRLLTVRLHGNGVVKNEKQTLTGGANYFTRKAGQFIFSKIDLLNGAFGIIPDSLDGFSSSTDVPTYSFNAKYSSTFFLNWLKANYDHLNIERTGTSSTLKRVSPEKFLALPILVPSLAEQQKIADCLTSLDELIAAAGRKLEALKAHKKGLMQQLFPREGETIPRLRFAKFRDGPKWKTRQLRDLLTERSEYPVEAVPLFSLTIENGVTPKTARYERSFLVNDEKDAYKLMLPNDFAFNPMNLRFGAIGRHSGTGNVAVSKYYNIFHCDDTVDARFCECYFKSDRMVSFYDDVAIGTLIEKRRVHFSDFLKFRVGFPSLPEQQRIADCLSTLDARIAAEADKLAALKTHKMGLMQQLFPSAEGD